MTVSIKVSVNGDYKVPVSVQQGGAAPAREVISGRGHDGPFVKDIPYPPGSVITVMVGPEQPDNG